MTNIELQNIKSTVSHNLQDKITRLLCVATYLKTCDLSMSEIEYIFNSQTRTISNLLNSDNYMEFNGINSNTIHKMYSRVVKLVNTFNQKEYRPVNCHNIYIKKNKLNNEMISDIKYLLNV